MRPEMTTHAFDLIVFDLDGTLIKTALEICDAVNDTLLQFELARARQSQSRGLATARASF